jgi:ketosteroid isomerase-like protein
MHSTRKFATLKGAAAALSLAAALAAALPLAARAATASTSAPADEIRQLEADINKAYAANDLPKYFSYYADDFRGLFPEGPTTLAQYKTTWTAYIKGGGKIVSFTYTDVQVNVSPSGDAAVASYRAVTTSQDAGKAPSEDRYLETDVFFKRGGQWKLVEVHYSLVPKDQK